MREPLFMDLSAVYGKSIILPMIQYNIGAWIEKYIDDPSNTKYFDEGSRKWYYTINGVDVSLFTNVYFDSICITITEETKPKNGISKIISDTKKQVALNKYLATGIAPEIKSNVWSVKIPFTKATNWDFYHTNEMCPEVKEFIDSIDALRDTIDSINKSVTEESVNYHLNLMNLDSIYKRIDDIVSDKISIHDFCSKKIDEKFIYRITENTMIEDVRQKLVDSKINLTGFEAVVMGGIFAIKNNKICTIKTHNELSSIKYKYIFIDIVPEKGE